MSNANPSRTSNDEDVGKGPKGTGIISDVVGLAVALALVVFISFFMSKTLGSLMVKELDREIEGATTELEERADRAVESVEREASEALEQPRVALLSKQASAQEGSDDAIHAAAVAGALDGALIRTPAHALDGAARTALQAAEWDCVVILGGVDAVHREVAEEISALGHPVARVEGHSRWDVHEALVGSLARYWEGDGQDFCGIAQARRVP